MKIRIYLVLPIMILCVSSYAQNLNANAGLDSVIMSEIRPAICILDGSGSTGDNTITQFYWVHNNDTIGNSATIMTDVEENETSFKLIVIDDQGNRDEDFIKIFIGHPTNNGKNRLPLRNGTELKFVSGMNIAWHKFAKDLNEFDHEDRAYFGELMDSISQNGGNALRWWLHTNGSSSPMVDATGHVSGIDFENIQAMKNMLDMAYDHGISVSMCLWSFDMLQRQTQNVDAMKLLLTNQSNIQSYIDNALIPILNYLGNHPAVMTWEIFNEPEGMSSNVGWSDLRIEFFDIQRFINMAAGAIHATTPGALVSNGSWDMKASTDVGTFVNRYSASKLLAAGGDPEGYLDFYQVHYYPKNFGNSSSLFHRPASFWELDAPIVIGEFPADTIAGLAKPGFSIEKAYERAVNYGYAGIMSWSWSDDNYNKDFNTTARGLRKVESMIPGDLILPQNVVIDRPPVNTDPILAFRSLVQENIIDTTYLNLDNYFDDDIDGGALTYSAYHITDESLLSVEFSSRPAAKLSLSPGKEGVAIITYRGSDQSDWYAAGRGIVMVGNESNRENNSAYFRPIIASASTPNQFKEYANDGNDNTDWENHESLRDTLLIDLESINPHNFFAIHWGLLSTTNFELQGSLNNIDWITLATQPAERVKKEVFTLDEATSIRYLKLILETDRIDTKFVVREIISDNVVDNKAPEVLKEVPDYEVDIRDVANVHRYFNFNEIFTDQEHSIYLKYTYESDNTDLLELEKTLDGKGLSMKFNDDKTGESLVTLSATDPFGLKISTTYLVTVTDLVTSIDDNNSLLSVYPNPTKGIIQIEFPNTDEYTINILNLTGISIYKETSSIKSKVIDLSSSKPGMYILRITQNNSSLSYRIIKE